ncbi:MAG: hypothetical protein AB8B52_03395 [Winogradskyella sp.]|uniref:HYC_CC_PP family protein n=1 Tax=Winogradskyella sp. TaxID=1883156 RepID=UPI0038598ECF
MKLSYTHKTISFTLSLLVLFSTLSLTIEKHFCGDVLIDVAIFSESEKCGAMELNKTGSSDNLTKTCCKDEIDVVEGISDLTINSFDDLEILQKQVLRAYGFSYVSLFEDLPNKVIPHRGYLPPTLIKDIHLLDETFLI